MEQTHNAQPDSIKSYWIIWFILLALSVGMIALDQTRSLGRGVLVAVLLVGMSVKAWLISSRFMHLKHEKRSFVLILVLSTLILVAFLVGLLAVDALSVLNRLTYR